MLKLYRRHIQPDNDGHGGCKHRAKGAKYTKCGCPIWIDGMHEGKRSRHSLDTFNWEVASKKLLKLTTGDDTKDCSVSDAVKDFIADKERCGNAESSVKKYREVLNPLLKFCDGRSITTVRALDLQTVKRFVKTLTDSSLVVGKKIERLRTFLRHCVELRWIESNPATLVKKPKVVNPPVLPFTTAEYEAILAAIEKYPTRNSFGYDNRARVRAFVLTLRYTGLRMSDVMKLRKEKINNGRVFLRTTKTGAPIYLPLPPALLDALKAIESAESPYYFWTGKAKLKSALTIWGESFSKLLELAKVEGHPHMFRHTLAIELLEKGALVEHVAAILGNTPAIVHKHYAPWVASRQKALDAAVRGCWPVNA